MPPPGGRLLGGSPWIDSRSAGNSKSPVNRKKFRFSGFLRKSVSKTCVDSGICGRSPSADSANNSEINSGIIAELTAELNRVSGEFPDRGISREIPKDAFSQRITK